MKKIAAIILVTMALGFSAPPAFAYSSLIYHLARYGCEGQSSYFKNGCYAYLEPRILDKKNPRDALKACKDQCKDWFDYSDAAVNKCAEGGKYLYGMDD